MKRGRVEGYWVDGDDMSAGGGADDAWLSDLRDEARFALIRRIVLERVANGGFAGGPRPVDLNSDDDGFGGLEDVTASGGTGRKPVAWGGVLRDVAIGVGVSIVSAWACMRLGLLSQQKRRA